MRQTHVREGCIHVVRLNVKLGPKQLHRPLYAYLRDSAVKKKSSLQCCSLLSGSPSIIPAFLQPVSSASRSMSLKLKWNIHPGDDGIMDAYSHTGSVNLNEALMGMSAYFWMVIDICYVISPHSVTVGFEIGLEMTHVLQCQVKGTHW